MRRYAIYCLVLVFDLPATRAGDPLPSEPWPQFRGPDGQGHVTSNMPTTWSEKDKVWDVALPGKGWSSPVVADGKVWITTAVPGQAKSHTLRALAVDQQNGKIVHDIELFTVSKPVELHARNTQSTPTPVASKGRLYVQFGGDGVACIDTKTASIIWKNDSLKVDYQTGAASSPILYKDLLIIPCDGADLQFAVALNIAAGDPVWKTERPIALAKKALDSRRAFSTPLVINVEGRDQVVIPGAFCVYSYDPATGEELWRVTYDGFSNIPRPVFAHGLVYVTSGFSTHHLLAIRPTGKGDVTKTHVAWRFTKNVSNVPSPVIVGDNLYMVHDKGQATCLDAKSGAVKWIQRTGTAYSASLLAKGNTIYAFADDGETTLFAAANSYKELGRNEITGKVQATPAPAGDHLYIRTVDRLVKVGPK